MQRYTVEITETLQMCVHVEADTPEEAEQIVKDQWEDEIYVLNSDNFTGAEFHVTGIGED